jgi:type IV secretion system protein VirD4
MMSRRPSSELEADERWGTNDGVYFGWRVREPEKPSKEQSLLQEAWTRAPDAEHRYREDRHLVTIGPNGTGKTRRLLFPNLVYLDDWSTLVVDPKGWLAAQTGPFREAKHPGSVMVIDPFGVIEADYPRLAARHPFLKSHGYNPVAALNPAGDDFPDDARRLGEALVPVESKGEPHWEMSAQDLVTGLIMSDRIQNGAQSSLTSVRKWVTADASDLARHISEVVDRGAGRLHEAIPAKLNRFKKITPDSRELLSIISTGQTRTAWLDSPPIQRDLTRGASDFGAMKESPKTVYLILPPRYLASHGTWLRLMVTAVLLPLMRSIRRRPVPVLFMLDEFAQFGRLKVIEDNLALMREYGVKLWLIFQDLAQAKYIYETRWESFIGNAGIVQSFAPQDMTTLKYLAELSGKRLYAIPTQSFNQSSTSGQSASSTRGLQDGAQHIQGPVIWEHELAQMTTGQAVVFKNGCPARALLPDPTKVPALERILLRTASESP